MAYLPKIPCFSVLTLLIFALSACAGDEDNKGEVSDIQILEFIADPEKVVEGESTTLRWSTKNATSVILIENGIKPEGGDLPPEGNLVVTPEGDTVYEIEARSGNGPSVVDRIEVIVEPFGTPQIASFTASPAVVAPGNPAVLSWRVAGAETVEIVTELGERVALIAPAEARGMHEVHPADSTKYALRARNSSGVSTAEVEVEVGRRPKISLELSAAEAAFGEELTLSWTVEDAERIAILDPLGDLVHEGPGEDGSISVEALRSGEYRATAIGLGGEEFALASLDVDPLVELFEALAFEGSRPGDDALVKWVVRGADRIVISDGVQDLFESREEEGEADVPMGESGTFELRAYSGSLVHEAYTSVSVVNTPLIRRVTRGPLVTAGQGIIGMSTIGWEIEGASKVMMEVDPGGIVDLSDKSPRLDEVEVLFRGPGTVTLTAFNAAGSEVVVIPSPVDPVPTIETLFAAPSRAGLGEFIDIHWSTLDAERVILEREGIELPIDEFEVVGKHRTIDPVTGTTQFVLRAFNTLGHEVISDPVVVEVGPPNQLRFETSDGQLLHRVDTKVQLVWENDGGTALTVTNVDTQLEVCSRTIFAEIRQGGCTITMPSEQVDVPLLLEVENASGTDSRLLELRAVKGPLISSFTTAISGVRLGRGTPGLHADGRLRRPSPLQPHDRGDGLRNSHRG